MSEKKTLRFCSYEIDNIINSLNIAIQEEYKNCDWEEQSNGRYWYTPNKKIKQLKFTINSINKQIKENDINEKRD